MARNAGRHCSKLKCGFTSIYGEAVACCRSKVSAGVFRLKRVLSRNQRISHRGGIVISLSAAARSIEDMRHLEFPSNNENNYKWHILRGSQNSNGSHRCRRRLGGIQCLISRAPAYRNIACIFAFISPRDNENGIAFC